MDVSMEPNAAAVQSIILDVSQLEQVETEEPIENHILSTCKSVRQPQNWTNLGIFMCVAYNFFLLLILLVLLKIFK